MKRDWGVSYIICAAGHGLRVRNINPHVPKPFLKVAGRTFLEWSLDSLPVRSGDQILVVLLKSHQHWAEKSGFHGPGGCPVEYVFLDEVTRGQAETALMCRPRLRHRAVVVYNSDTYFRDSALADFMVSPEVDGLIPCSVQPGEEWSFALVEGPGPLYHTVDVTEKVRVSDFCSVGFYYFREGDLFFDMVERQIASAASVGELYVAPFYRELIRRGRGIYSCLVEVFQPMGTLGQLHRYWNADLTEMRKENS